MRRRRSIPSTIPRPASDACRRLVIQPGKVFSKRAASGSANASCTVAYFGFIDTNMVREAFADPLAARFEKTFPGWMTKRLQASDAGRGIVDGIEKRRRTVILPSWWRVYSGLRGVINPLLDRAMERDDDLQEVLVEADTREPAKQKSTA